MRDRCGVCGEGGATQCVYYAGHSEKLHRLAHVDVPWPPVYFKYFEEEVDDTCVDMAGE